MSVSGIPTLNQLMPNLSGGSLDLGSLSSGNLLAGQSVSSFGAGSPVFPNGLGAGSSQSAGGSTSDPLAQAGLSSMSSDTQALFLGIQSMMVGVMAVIASVLQSVLKDIQSGNTGSGASSLATSQSAGTSSAGISGNANSGGSNGSNSSGGSSGGSGDVGPLTPGKGNIPQNAQAMFKYLTDHGLSKNAAAGVIGNIYGESGGDPESVGSGGNGLIGWTPPLAGAVTGNKQKDLAFQLNAVMDYINKNGSVADINAHAGSPAEAAKYFCYHYERPLDPAGDSPKREDSATAVAAQFG